MASEHTETRKQRARAVQRWWAAVGVACAALCSAVALLASGHPEDTAGRFFVVVSLILTFIAFASARAVTPGHSHTITRRFARCGAVALVVLTVWCLIVTVSLAHGLTTARDVPSQDHSLPAPR